MACEHEWMLVTITGMAPRAFEQCRLCGKNRDLPEDVLKTLKPAKKTGIQFNPAKLTIKGKDGTVKDER